MKSKQMVWVIEVWERGNQRYVPLSWDECAFTSRAYAHLEKRIASQRYCQPGMKWRVRKYVPEEGK